MQAGWQDLDRLVTQTVVLTSDGMPAPEMQPGDGPPPAALMDAPERDGAPAGTIRQTPLLDEAGSFTGLEVSVALGATT